MSRYRPTKPILRYATHFALFITIFYAIFYVTISEETWSNIPLPEYLKPGDSLWKGKATKPLTSQQIKEAEKWAERAESVKAAFMHAYHGYEKYAAPWDELRPVSNGRGNP